MNDAPSLPHLHHHHGDFAAFAQVMIESAKTRFGPLWWGVWDQYVAPHLPADGTVVDLGCGPGGLFRTLRAHHPQVHVTGVEIQPAMLVEARKLAQELGNCDLVEADLALQLPLTDGTADAVTASMLLHEMPEPLPVLREMQRILKPGAPFLIYDWVKQPLRQYVDGKVPTGEVLQHFREHCLYTPDDLLFLCETAGLHVVEVIGRRGGDYAMLAGVSSGLQSR